MSAAVEISSRPLQKRTVFVGSLRLEGNLQIPHKAWALVIFVHGSGSSRFSPRNRAVADALNTKGIATLLFDLLTAEEEENRSNVFDVALLAGRLVSVVEWIRQQSELARLPIGFFGASTGAAAALVAAAQLGHLVGAVVSRGGRPDLADEALDKVTAPTLLIVGGFDYGVIELNQEAFARLRGTKSLTIVPGATHLFPEPGALEEVIALAAAWFGTHLAERARRATQ